MTIKAQIVAYAKAHPNLRNYEIAAALNVKPAYVSQSLIEANMADKRRVELKAIGEIPKMARIGEDNMAWAIKQSHRHRVTVHQFLNNVVTKVRLDQERKDQAK